MKIFEVENNFSYNKQSRKNYVTRRNSLDGSQKRSNNVGASSRADHVREQKERGEPPQPANQIKKKLAIKWGSSYLTNSTLKRGASKRQYLNPTQILFLSYEYYHKFCLNSFFF